MAEITNPHDISPLRAAEDVPLEALQATMPQGRRARLSVASALIEMSFHGQPELLDRAEEVIGRNLDDPIRKYPAYTYDAYLPLFYARANNRHPTQEEIIDTFGALHGHLGSIRQFFTLNDTEVGRIFRRANATTVNYTRGFVRGIFGQTVTLYASAYSSITHGEELLYPSSFREDNPTEESVRQLFGEHVHDAHTYNPAEPSNRATLSVKNSAYSGRTTQVRRFDVMGTANTVYRGSQPQRYSGLNEKDVLLLFMAAGDPSSPGHKRALRFRDGFAAELQSTIATQDNS